MLEDVCYTTFRIFKVKAKKRIMKDDGANPTDMQIASKASLGAAKTKKVLMNGSEPLVPIYSLRTNINCARADAIPTFF